MAHFAPVEHVNLIGIVGSLREGSVNGALARAATGLMPEASTLTLHSVREVPLYHGDEDAAGPPEPVTQLREAVRAADGIVLFSPEYNSSLPAVTKNVIDWLSRDASAWDGTAITLVVMSPGGRAGLGVREHFSAIMPYQATRVFETLGLGNYPARLGADGEVADPATLDELGDFLSRFVDFCRA